MPFPLIIWNNMNKIRTFSKHRCNEMYEMIERCTHVKERHTIFPGRTYKVDVKREKDFIGINKWQHPGSWSSCLDRQPTSMFYIFVVYIIFRRNLEYTSFVLCRYCRCFKCKQINKASMGMIFWNRISFIQKNTTVIRTIKFMK